jgi:hypothetical protein
MQIGRTRYGRGAALVVIIALVVVIAGLLTTASVGTGRAGASGPAPKAGAKASGARSQSQISVHTVNLADVPQATPAQLRAGAAMASKALNHYGTLAGTYQGRKLAAARSKSAPSGYGGVSAPQSARSRPVGTATPGALTAFAGISSGNCPFFGGDCEPSDMGVGANGAFVVQTVNTALAVYDATTGFLYLGPKQMTSFFGVPNPSPAGCASLPFMSDPRVAFDPNDQRWYVSMIEVEGITDPKGPINPACSPISVVWTAHSNTSDPRGTWSVISIQLQNDFPGFWCDYPTLGYDPQGLYFGCNMFTFNGSSGFHNEIDGISKGCYTGGSCFLPFFLDLNVSGTDVDTIQPVETAARRVGPQTEFAVNSFNLNFGSGQCSAGCSGLVVWALSDLANEGSNGWKLSGDVISSDGYSLAPLAYNPPAAQNIETIDTRISGTPTYENGRIYFGLDTAVNNGAEVVPGIYWGVIDGYLNDSTISGCGLCTTINGGTAIDQQGYFFFNFAGAAFFPTLDPDQEGNIFLSYNFSSTSTDPSAVVASRRVTQPPGGFHDAGTCYPFCSGTAYTGGLHRWGDYSAASFTGLLNNVVWTAGETTAGCTTLWCTELVKNQYTPDGT